MSNYFSQSNQRPLFPDIEWERPENLNLRGELLIVGGSPHGFASIANSYEYSKKAGIGRVRLALPEGIKTAVNGFVENAEFLPSTPSGSFSKRGLTQLKTLAVDSWATLLAGEFGRNSETASLLEGFILSTSQKIALTKDAIDYATTTYPKQLLGREHTLVVISFSQLQKLLKNAAFGENVKFEMTLETLTKFLSAITNEFPAQIITSHHKQIFVASNGQVSITKHTGDEVLWQTKLACFATVYWLQHPSKEFEALTTGVFEALRS